MARNSTHIDAPPEDVWAVFEDPYAYPEWVVGADRTLSADPAWPAPGSEFEVRLAFGAVDKTRARERVPGRRLALDAGTLFGPARVTLELEAEGGGSRVTLIEDPAGKMTPAKYFPPTHLALRLRNAESVRRLRRVVEQRSRRGATGAAG